MMAGRILHSLLLLILLYSFSSCKSRFHRVGCDNSWPAGEWDSVDAKSELLAHEFTFQHLNLKARVSQSDGKSEQTFQVSLKMIRDSFIWGSVSALGIEGARLYIDRDSFLVLDRLNKTYVREGLTHLSSLLGQEFELYEIQDILLGNPNKLLWDGRWTADTLLGTHIDYRNNMLQLTGTFNSCLKLNNYLVKASEDHKTLEVSYSDFVKIRRSGLLPRRIELNATDGNQTFHVLLEYQSLDQEPVGNLSFQIPARYDRKK